MSEDTPCVARLREAGAVFLAKTATPEAGCKVVTRSAVHGVTANPYDLSKTPGGSSGGAAAALALGFGPVALGSDGAGSIRIPAAFTNLFGIKPGFGRVPAFPPDIDMPHSVVGPLSRTVTDAAIMLDIISRPEPRDPYAWPVPFAMPDDLENPDLRGLTVAFSSRLGCTAPLADAETDGLVAEAAGLLMDVGVRGVRRCAGLAGRSLHSVQGVLGDRLPRLRGGHAAGKAAASRSLDPARWRIRRRRFAGDLHDGHGAAHGHRGGFQGLLQSL